jgi:hypothetical protein
MYSPPKREKHPRKDALFYVVIMLLTNRTWDICHIDKCLAVADRALFLFQKIINEIYNSPDTGCQHGPEQKPEPAKLP